MRKMNDGLWVSKIKELNRYSLNRVCYFHATLVKKPIIQYNDILLNVPYYREKTLTHRFSRLSLYVLFKLFYLKVLRCLGVGLFKLIFFNLR